MAKRKRNPDETPKELPHIPPVEPIDDVVEFLDEAESGGEPVDLSYEGDANFDTPPKSTDSAPHVSSSSRSPRPKETDSVLDDELVSFSQPVDPALVSGIFSSVIRHEPESGVLSNSGIVRGEPLSDSVAIDPISDIESIKADSDVRAVEPMSGPPSVRNEELVDDAVLDDALTEASDGAIALPESAVTDEDAAFDGGEDAIGGELLPDVTDSSVSLKSFRGAGRRSPEKEPVIDLDDALTGVDSPQPVKAEAFDAALAPESGSSNDVDLAEILDDDHAEGSAVNLGQKPPRMPGQSGIDRVAESLESGVRLDVDDEATDAPRSGPRLASPPSVEFDELLIDDDDIASVDLGSEDAPAPGKKSARLPKSDDEIPVMVEDDIAEPAEIVDIEDVEAVEDIASVEAEAEPVAVADDDIDINALLGDETIAAPAASAVDDEDVTPAIDDEPVEVSAVDDSLVDVEDDAAPPVTTPRRGKGPAGRVDDAPAPYQEPKRRGGFGSLVGGMVLGTMLTAGAAAGVYFGAPDLIPGLAKDDVKLDAKPAVKTPAMMAREQMDRGEYTEALAQLSEAADTQEVAALRGEARWLAYLNKSIENNTPLQKDDPAVKTAEEDFLKANLPVKIRQMHLALDGKSAKEAADLVKTVQEDLKKVTDEKLKAEESVAAFEKALTAAKILPDGDKLNAASADKVAKELGATKQSLAALNKLLADAKIDGMDEKGVENLVAAKIDFEQKFEDVNKMLKDEKIKDVGVKGLKELLDHRDAIAKEREELNLTLQTAFKEFAEAKFVPENGDPRKDFLAGVKSARSKAESPLGGPLNSLAGSLASVSLGFGDLVKHSYEDVAIIGEIQFLRLRDALIPSTEQQLDRLLAALADRQQKDPAVLADASKLSDWVEVNGAKLSPAIKAKALFVRGLAQRNQQKFADARQSLGAAVEIVNVNDVPWAARARQSLAELTDPTVYYIPRIDALRQNGKIAEALRELDAALVAIPDHPRLMAERGLLSLDTAKGPIDDKTRAAVRADAETAVRDPKSAASGNFVLGKLEEQQGNLPKAEELYRQALKSVGNDEDQAAAIRLRLGRLLLRERAAGAFAPRPAAPDAAPALPPEDPKDEKKEIEKDAANVPGPKLSYVHPLSGLVAAAILSQAEVDEDDPETQARLKESIEIAKQLLASKDVKIRAQGHFLLGEALSRMGQRTEGLRQYARGFELLHPDAQVTRLLDEHPAFSVPDSAQRANPLLAEKHYGIGLHHFHRHQYAEAEAQFKQALAYFDKDARYFYFLGLSQMEQGTRIKRDAALFAWEQAARLEANGRPSSNEVNSALERIQGERRSLLNSYRTRPALLP